MPPPGRLLPGIVALGALLLGTAACSTGAGAEPRNEQRDFALPNPRVTIDVSDGDLSILTGGSHRVRVDRWLAGKAAEKGNASWSMHNGTLRMRVKCSGIVLECDFSHRVTVPSGTAITVHDHDGDVTGTGLVGDTTVETDTGHVALRFARAPSRVKVGSDTGNIAVTVPRRHPAYRLNLHSDTGGVRSQIADRDRAGRSVTARTSTGNVRLRLTKH